MLPADTDGYTVDVRIGLTDNLTAFQTALTDASMKADGHNTPESIDECLNTVVNELAAAGRQDTNDCAPLDKVLQVGDFSGSAAFRSGNVMKLVVVLTDAGPDGFCDVENSYTTAAAHDYAAAALENGIQINAIQMAQTENELA